MSLLLLLRGAEGEGPSDVNRTRVTREHPPMRQYLLATTPSGRPIRWGEDEPGADRVFEDLTDSDSVPGGCKELACSLPRKPNVDYDDMQRGTRFQLFGAGNRLIWEGSLQDAPRTSGDRLLVDPAAVGYQSHLTDDESARCIPIDADMRGWGEPSSQRKIDVPANQYNVNAQVSLIPAGTPDPDNLATFSRVPAISHSWSQIHNHNGTEPDVAESWYDSGGVELGRIMADFVRVKGLGAGDVGWNNEIQASRDGVTLNELLKDFNATSQSSASFSVAAQRFFLMLRDYYGPTINGVSGNWEAQWRNVKVFDRSGIPLYGDSPNVGVLFSDVVAYALGQWCPLLHFTTGPNGTVRPTKFVIPHLPFKEATTVQEMITKGNRFELNEFAVWPGQYGPTFFLNPRGERVGRKRWRVRSREARLKETGPSMSRVVNGVLVQWQDVDGSTRVIAPTGSGYPIISDRLLDLDPLNPANQLNKRQWKKIAMKSVSTQRGAEETGERYIEMMKLLDGSGAATVTGFVEDEFGALWPYYCVRSGDILDPLDSSAGTNRYVVNVDRSRGSRQGTLTLDAPPDTHEAALEQLDVYEVAAGFGG